MKNPWEEISLDDYEKHMSLNSVMQLQTMNSIMKDQLEDYPVETAAVLGIAGGNGLEHVRAEKYSRVYGIDINKEYLETASERYKNLSGILECLRIDTTGFLIRHIFMLLTGLIKSIARWRRKLWKKPWRKSDIA